MAHYANIYDGKVTQVIKADAEFIAGLPGQWVQTSYNTYGGQHPGGTPLRKNYAGVGFAYDAERDAFIPPQPFPSWTLDEDSCLWVAPVARPAGDIPYFWDEATLKWLQKSS